MKENRRKFVNLLIGGGFLGWIGSIFYPVLNFLKPPKITEPVVLSVNAAKIDDVPPNSGRIIRFGQQPVILLRTDTGEFRAFSAICTHLSCIVQYRGDFKHIWCACHNGHYDLQGRNISGPPPRPLEKYAVKLVDQDVFVVKEAPSS